MGRGSLSEGGVFFFWRSGGSDVDLSGLCEAPVDVWWPGQSADPSVVLRSPCARSPSARGWGSCKLKEESSAEQT